MDGIASRNIENNIKKLKEYGILIRHGSPKNGYWEIVDKELQEWKNRHVSVKVAKENNME